MVQKAFGTKYVSRDRTLFTTVAKALSSQIGSLLWPTKLNLT